MATETKLNLKESTIEKLQDLIQVNIDSAKGFEEAANNVDDSILADKLRQIASERQRQATELQDYVCANNEEPRREGSYAASMHRTWMDIRAMFTSNDTYAIMAEAERGEDKIKEAYEDALKDEPGTAMNDVLLRQYENVKSIHDSVRDIRDSLKS